MARLTRLQGSKPDETTQRVVVQINMEMAVELALQGNHDQAAKYHPTLAAN